MSLQKTIKKPVDVVGPGLFGGESCTLRFNPGEPNSGIVFVRTDLGEPVRIHADVANVVKRPRRTTLVNGSASVETVEHVLSAAWGLDLDNLVIEVSAAETPSIDGSPLAFAEALTSAGVLEQEIPQKVYVIEEAISISEGDAMLAALPGPVDCLDILYDLDYGNVPSIGRQVLGFRLGKDDYMRQIAPSRTFLLEAEAKQFRAQGLGEHLTTRDVLVMGNDGPVENQVRFPDEHVRHKVADLIGDLALLGRHLRGRIVAYKSGHELNQNLVRKLLETIATGGRTRGSVHEPLMDIRQIMRMLPHRYPFLMVDRIIEIEGDKRAVGIKNVSMNEPYFQGHYPGQPIMPGVMQVEAMAQLAGILVSRRLEHAGKLGFLLSIDRVKLRRLVYPGDQLILEAEAIHVRSRTAHCRCRALVGNDVAAEAEIKFMLVDAEPA